MFCTRCGSQLTYGVNYCTSCGSRVVAATPTPTPPPIATPLPPAAAPVPAATPVTTQRAQSMVAPQPAHMPIQNAGVPQKCQWCGALIDPGSATGANCPK